jgi:hypothetical protein
MKPRLRLLAALLALSAFSASMAEQAWASMCAMPAADMSGAAPAPMAEHTMPADAPVRHDAPAGHSDSSMPCPLQAVSSTCSVVLLPSAEPPRPAPVSESGGRVGALPDQLTHLLIGSFLFRPPQA